MNALWSTNPAQAARDADLEYRKRIAGLQRQIRELEAENEGLRARFTDGKKMPWDLAKVARQRQALARMNKRLRSQRLVLHAIDELDRGLTGAEYQELVKNRHPAEKLLEASEI